MYAQAAIKSNILLRNGAYGIVMRGVHFCTCAGASLRSRNSVPLCCIIYMTVYEPGGRSGQVLICEYLIEFHTHCTSCARQRSYQSIVAF